MTFLRRTGDGTGAPSALTLDSARPAPLRVRDRPIVGLTLSFVLGTLLGWSLRLPIEVTLACAAAAVLGAILGRSSNRGWVALRLALLHSAVVLLAVASVHLTRAGAGGIADLAGAGAVDITGVVDGDPASRPDRYATLVAWRFPVRVESARTATGQVATGGRLLVFWRAPRQGDRPHYGERWAIHGRILPPRYAQRGPAPPAQSICFAQWSRSRLVSHGHGSRVIAAIQKTRRDAARLLSAGVEDFPNQTGLAHALLLGYRTQLPSELLAVFRKTGTLHIFAISGLHVGMIAGMIIFVLNACRVPHSRWILFLAPLLIIYTLATGARPSAVRACVMAIVYFVAPLLRRRPDSLSAVSFAGLLILAFAPAEIYSVGFIYSFVVVIGLITLYPVFEQPLMRIARMDPLRAGEVPAEVQVGHTIARYFVGLLAASIAAWLCSAPLTAYFFGRWAPIALIGNLFVIPLAFAILLTGCLTLTVGACVGFLAEVFNHANLALITVLNKGIEAASTLPGAHARTDPISIWIVVAWYATLAAIKWRSVVQQAENADHRIEPPV